MRGKKLPHGGVIGINRKVLSAGQQDVAGKVKILSSLDERLLCLASLGADLGRGGGKLRERHKCIECLYSLDQELGGFGTSLAVSITQVTSKGLQGGGRGVP